MINKIFYILSYLKKTNLFFLIKIVQLDDSLKILDKRSQIFMCENDNNLSVGQRQGIITIRVICINLQILFLEDARYNRIFQLENQIN
jgi:ABC-type bacteriocin/lantibiotic exporter with double-glycine peptidase domain